MKEKFNKNNRKQIKKHLTECKKEALNNQKDLV